MSEGFMRGSTAAMVLGVCLSIFAGAASAQVVFVPYDPQPGSANPATSAPPVSRPSTKPCVVTLFQNQAFADFSAKPFSYAPPAACPGPWAKVVLQADFTVTEGIQYDRTAQFFLGNSNIFYGTTAEPGSNLSPSWRIESDLTDFSTLLSSPQSGAANIGNLVNSTYTGIIYATATLSFYPSNTANPAAKAPDVVLSMNTGQSAATISTGRQILTQSVTLPRNTERAYLDVIAQSQSSDEFWYFCVPTALGGELESCGNTAFRETEITIDGHPAGVAPIYPWIYTGGIDPYLWLPITGIQTLNFKPYRVDLTPFVGRLVDGQPHVVGIGVFNADNYFVVAANLFAYQDHGSTQVTGGVLENTLTAAPSPKVASNLSTDANGTTTGTLSVTSARAFTIKGYVNTSHGWVQTTVEQSMNFSNDQIEDVNPNTGPDEQYVVQNTNVNTKVTTHEGAVTEVKQTDFSYPLALNYRFLYNADGSYTQVVDAQQEYLLSEFRQRNSEKPVTAALQQVVRSEDSLPINASGEISAAGTGTSSSSYVSRDLDGTCFNRSLAAASHVLSSVTTDDSCE